ncbi:MAG TPA: hypothetical protein VG456_28415 [Candidatus Sulfopaludibacter sp.]|jgi:thioredoxin-like negative regulator of GroEL|nr:hypothetical protein [Candidatus Sulfopaludibacter sp.]
MTCETIDRANILDRYLAGELEPALKEEWESHYFGCDRCAALLETRLAIQESLQSLAPEIRQEIAAPRRRPNWLWIGAAVAAALAIAAGLTYQNRATVQPTSSRQELAELARLDPPAYAATVLRGAPSKAESQFEAAMQAYSRRDYPQAAEGLRQTLTLDSGAEAARFFLGACDVLTGKTEDGVRELRGVSAGHSPFAEEAAFDLSKAYLLQGDRAAALQNLQRIADGNGDFAGPAKDLIARLERIAPK